MSGIADRMRAVRVWDGPTRLFHWLLVGLFGFSWWSAENREMEWHVLSGLALLGLLVFRLLWGLFGGSTARFGSFVKPPRVVIAYVQRKGTAAPGHNPLGGYSVVAMLSLLTVQVMSGLFATDVDGLDSGPLSFLVSFDQSRLAAEVHETAFNIFLVLIGIHILAVLFYLTIRRRNLVLPMLKGTDPALDPADGELVPAAPWKFPLLAGGAAAFAWWTSTGFGL